MSIVKRNNLAFPSLMNEIFKPDWFGGMENVATSTPAVNIKDNEKSFELDLIVPGRKKEDFNIEVDNELLTISAELKDEKEVKEENYTRREFRFSSFKRAFTLPESINVDDIKADYIDGVLKIELPKKEEALPKPKRLIELK
ncbi:Hsp20/alpha crystallin family protein [Zobellia sp. 1_MG-2023]|uniref:Hsp20/alpha crystallin family protein n=1 Tax=Zobellia sp. 1_MG-2023 TaxID=3062626 RepID=UPI0026E422C9|nr:Hsp20/alpha crystallin family protein [Zobellia sp. 1_MG-2023]MDO6821114.1 Hsp20/alpha crystallin family protein [Zobellia sp. 1_MG-2023]